MESGRALSLPGEFAHAGYCWIWDKIWSNSEKPVYSLRWWDGLEAENNRQHLLFEKAARKGSRKAEHHPFCSLLSFLPSPPMGLCESPKRNGQDIHRESCQEWASFCQAWIERGRSNAGRLRHPIRMPTCNEVSGDEVHALEWFKSGQTPVTVWKNTEDRSSCSWTGTYCSSIAVGPDVFIEVKRTARDNGQQSGFVCGS